MTNSDKRSPIEDLLVAGLDDWLDTGWMVTPIWDSTPPPNRKATAVGLIAELLIDELMVAGALTDRGFEPWECSPGDSLSRITREWLDVWRDVLPTPGAIAWFAITKKGTQLAQAVLAREDAESRACTSGAP
jgi:hypothetical protein